MSRHNPEAPITPRRKRPPALEGTKADAGYGTYEGPPWIVVNPVTGQMWQPYRKEETTP